MSCFTGASQAETKDPSVVTVSSSSSSNSDSAPGEKKQMPVSSVRKSQVAYPTGDPKFSVMQPFPAAVSAEEADPFLMCDFFGPARSSGVAQDPDEFSVGWHPHRGMDICTYLTEGVGRHADSLGNREVFNSPGMQWCSVGSGIEHAEGGGTPAGQNMEGFQIWINVPSAHKMDDPRYGIVPPEKLPVVQLDDGAVKVRVVSGPFRGTVGPFETVQSLQMLDAIFEAEASLEHDMPEHMETCLVYVYKGSVTIAASNREVKAQEIAVLDGRDPTARTVVLRAGAKGASVMLMAGKRINEPIAWHGPFVMNTQAEIRKTFVEYRNGQFPPKRVPWDYKDLSTFPKDHPARQSAASLLEKDL